MNDRKPEIKHDIFGEKLSYWDLKNFKTLEKFHDSNHDKRSLVQGKNGTLYLYDFHEIMGFPDDYIYEHLFVLESEEQGKKIADKDMMTLKSELTKFIWIGPDYEIKTNG